MLQVNSTTNNTLQHALALDANDALKTYREQFYIPTQKDGSDVIYLCGNSLGLQPKSTKLYLQQELDDWANLGVEGHTAAKNPWLHYHELLTNNMATVVGALPTEVVVMNTLTTNLHLMMVSFYTPTNERYKILTDWNPFPSDSYALASQVQLHGYNPTESIVAPTPIGSSATITTTQILELLAEQGHQIALVMIGTVNYYSGQVYDMATITKAAHSKGCKVGFDLAHAVGNIPMQLHQTGADFAVWCTYKYLNSGPGSLAGCFVHERHHHNFKGNRLTGWWGTNKQSRFAMLPQFDAIPTAEAWQLSNPPILSMAAIHASLQLFAAAGMVNLIKKSEELTSYLINLLQQIPTTNIEIITPIVPEQRGCQISLRIKNNGKQLHTTLTSKGIVTDWREPDVIRVAPVPLYNTFEDVYRFVAILQESIEI